MSAARRSVSMNRPPPACAANLASRARDDVTMTERWHLTGQVLIACNCDWGCPCNFNARPSRGYCEGGWIWVFERAHVQDVQLDGLGVALFAKWPGAIHEGGGHAACYLDDRADVAQRAALDRVVRGELGGPWGLFLKTYDLAAPVTARFTVALTEYASVARFGDAVELK